jgi:hypothetical protein
LTLLPAYLCQKDKRVLSKNPHNSKRFRIPCSVSLNTCFLPLLTFCTLRSQSDAAPMVNNEVFELHGVSQK